MKNIVYFFTFNIIIFFVLALGIWYFDCVYKHDVITFIMYCMFDIFIMINAMKSARYTTGLTKINEYF